MAFANKGDIQPMRPYGANMDSSGTVVYVPMTASAVFRVGDIVTLASGLALVDNVEPANILGIAMEAKTAPGTVTYDNRVKVALAIPGALFIGTLVAAADTDYSNPAATVPNAGVYDVIQETDTGRSVACVNQADTTNGAIKVLLYAPAQTRGRTMVTGTGGTVSPQVIFTFSIADTVYA